MHHQPAFIAPTQHTDAASAWQQVQTLYAHSVAHLRQAMQDFVAGRDVPDQRIRACYPFVRLHARRAFECSRCKGCEWYCDYVAHFRIRWFGGLVARAGDRTIPHGRATKLEQGLGGEDTFHL